MTKTQKIQAMIDATNDLRWQKILDTGILEQENFEVYESESSLVLIDVSNNQRRFVCLSMWGDSPDLDDLKSLFDLIPGDLEFVGFLGTDCSACFVFGEDILPQIMSAFSEAHPEYTFVESGNFFVPQRVSNAD